VRGTTICICGADRDAHPTPDHPVFILARPRRRKPAPAPQPIEPETLAKFAERPLVRGDCKDGPRPCPWVGCRHHLYAEVTVTGELRVLHPGKEPWEMAHSCSLDVADQGGVRLEDIGRIAGVTRERIRQIELAGLVRLRTRRGLR
jgi:Sigma-70, region 4